MEQITAKTPWAGHTEDIPLHLDYFEGSMVEAVRLAAEKYPEGSIVEGKVVRIMDFGAFVEIVPGMDGLVHISKLDKQRVEKVEDVVSIGDEIVVKVTEIDRQGRINLSRKDALAAIEAKRNAE